MRSQPMLFSLFRAIRTVRKRFKRQVHLFEKASSSFVNREMENDCARARGNTHG